MTLELIGSGARALGRAMACIAILHGLVACGPAEAPPSLRLDASDARVRTLVGTKDASGQLTSSGQAGFLMFGPYVKWPKGKYKVVISGTILEGTGELGWIDIAADEGKRRLVIAPLRQEAPGTLATVRLNFDDPVDKLEVRVYVEKNVKVAIKGYEISPVN